MDFRAHLVSWADIENWCSSIRHKIVDDFTPDVIVGLSRGGLVPARIMSDYLWIKDLLTVKTEHWGITANTDGKATLSNTSNLNVQGRKVLIVDDITDTGQSMKLAYDFIKSRNPGELKTATLLHINRSEFVPDYYGEEVSQERWTWFIFPWNVYEDLSNLLSKVLGEEMDLQGIKQLLMEHYDLTIDDEHLSRVLSDFARSGKLKHVSGMYAPVQSPGNQ